MFNGLNLLNLKDVSLLILITVIFAIAYTMMLRNEDSSIDKSEMFFKSLCFILPVFFIFISLTAMRGRINDKTYVYDKSYKSTSSFIDVGSLKCSNNACTVNVKSRSSSPELIIKLRVLEDLIKEEIRSLTEETKLSITCESGNAQLDIIESNLRLERGKKIHFKGQSFLLFGSRLNEIKAFICHYHKLLT